MADLIQGISYKQLRRVSDWQMTQEAQRAALAAVVHAISRLDTTIYWGEGRTSASDGQRFALPRRILQQTYSTCFSDFALEFYTFLADNYAPFHSMPVECTDRDAAFVLDGLLYNESDLGRILKTEFLLSYLSEPRLRARIRRGLLKVEQLHALARDIYYGRRGRINALELHEQMNSCSCLTLLLACVVYWQAKEISRVLKMGIPEGEDINISLLEHVSPIEWENVILYGQYVLNPDDIR